MIPEFDEFVSDSIADGRGCIYQVHGRTGCLAYWIDDAETLRAFGAIAGFLLYAFVERDSRGRARRVGTWREAMHADDLLEALETARAAFDPDAPRPKHRTMQELIDERLTRRPMTINIDLEELEP